MATDFFNSKIREYHKDFLYPSGLKTEVPIEEKKPKNSNRVSIVAWLGTV